jgi:hypothetical protein
VPDELDAIRKAPVLAFAAFWSTASLVIGLLGWLPLFLSAGLAMGSAKDTAIAVPLAIAGAAALIGSIFGTLALRSILRLHHTKPSAFVLGLSSILGLLVSLVLGIVALVFALSFRW